jgi:hypothetical protein
MGEPPDGGDRTGRAEFGGVARMNETMLRVAGGVEQSQILLPGKPVGHARKIIDNHALDGRFAGYDGRRRSLY